MTIRELFLKIHPKNQTLIELLTEFLEKLNIQTISQLLEFKIDKKSSNSIESFDINIPNFLNNYWEYFLMDIHNFNRMELKSFELNESKLGNIQFNEFIRFFLEILIFKQKLEWRDYLLDEFNEIWPEDYKKIKTKKKRFIKNAYKEIDLMTEFNNQIILYIISRKKLTSENLIKFKALFDHLVQLCETYKEFNTVQVKDSDGVETTESVFLEDVGGSLGYVVKYIKEKTIELLLPWSDKELLLYIIQFWQAVATTL